MAGTGDYTFVLARLGPLHLGCNNREVAALLAQVDAYSGFTVATMFIAATMRHSTCVVSYYGEASLEGKDHVHMCYA